MQALWRRLDPVLVSGKTRERIADKLDRVVHSGKEVAT